MHSRHARLLLSSAFALLLGFLPLMISHPTRYLSGHGMVGPVLLAAHFAEEFLEVVAKKKPSTRSVTIGGMILAGVYILLLAPVLGLLKAAPRSSPIDTAIYRA